MSRLRVFSLLLTFLYRRHADLQRDKRGAGVVVVVVGGGVRTTTKGKEKRKVFIQFLSFPTSF